MLIRALRPRHSRDAAEGMEENSRRKTTPDDVEPRGYQNKGAVRLAEGLWWRRRPMVVTRTMKDQISSDLDRTPAVPEIECVEESECWCYRARAVDVELSAWAHRAVQCRLLPFVAESVLGVVLTTARIVLADRQAIYHNLLLNQYSPLKIHQILLSSQQCQFGFGVIFHGVDCGRGIRTLVDGDLLR
ncbi:hypothetical protein T11_9865 [Trichinella zimbabwensis]|uniref:Uncharacterized protein n=1 Tax=Trichinella zimbabwensis TaxID=268475 RepID=A0A0V1HY20_9BILA|nr:hypothetical protein T11_9865 [Trichinella zimbabwensis]